MNAATAVDDDQLVAVVAIKRTATGACTRVLFGRYSRKVAEQTVDALGRVGLHAEIAESVRVLWAARFLAVHSTVSCRLQRGFVRSAARFAALLRWS